MKFLFAMLFVLSSSLTWANCLEAARSAAHGAVEILNVSDDRIHCAAVGGLESLESLPVILVLPPRSVYEATFFFPCGPQPRSPKVRMVFNQECKLTNLTLTGHEL